LPQTRLWNQEGALCLLSGCSYSLGYDQEAGRRKEYERSLLLTCPAGQVSRLQLDRASSVIGTHTSALVGTLTPAEREIFLEGFESIPFMRKMIVAFGEIIYGFEGKLLSHYCLAFGWTMAMNLH